MSDEAAIRTLHDAGDLDEATTETLKRYGPEILGMLVALHKDQTAAGDAFSEFSERLWRSMDRFRWDCTMRTWAYAIARAASIDQKRSAERVRARHVPLSQSSRINQMAEHVKSTSLSYLRSDKVSAIQRLREELSEDDQALLVMRVDREMSWPDLARIFVGEGADEDALKREAARLRKRYQTMKERLLKMAKKQGLVKKG
jgi:RNA polymerase sigma-70 factor, ECF subfamily